MTQHRQQSERRKEQKEQTLSDLLRDLNIKSSQWDALLIGDGSASDWRNECGWCSVLITYDFQREIFYGSCNKGTNNVAEMMAYVMPLMYLSSQFVPTANRKTCRVRVITDSEYVAKGINGVTNLKSNTELWSVLNSAKYNGLSVAAHWIPRDTVDLNKLCHDVANYTRQVQKDLLHQVIGDRTAYDFTPEVIKES